MANRRNRRRRRVEKVERVKPPPEAAQHYRPWPMQLLLIAGPDHGGIDADEFEASLQIVETFRALTGQLGVQSITIEGLRGGGAGSMSDRDAELVATWFDWSLLLPRGFPARLVRWIEDDEPILSVILLRRACRLWQRERHRRAKECPRTVDKTAPGVLTIPLSGEFVRLPNITASPVNLPAQHDQPFMGLPHHRPAPLAQAAHCTATAHAPTAKPPSPIRPRR